MENNSKQVANKTCDFISFQRSLSSFTKTESVALQFFKIVAAILKLGNVNFIPVSNIDGTEGCGLELDYGK